jgi:hypothetical protein
MNHGATNQGEGIGRHSQYGEQYCILYTQSMD